MDLASRTLYRIYQSLFANYGPQNWWPGETRFEILVGAILTQNTAWINVERAIVNLKSAALLSLEALDRCPIDDLAGCIRPAGYFNIKTQRLKNFCRFLRQAGGAQAIDGWTTNTLRESLLSVKGIGPETADDMLLYAFQRPVFVIDAYTRRLGKRLGLFQGSENYEQLRHGFEQALSPDVSMYNEFHALIVRHAKEICTSRRPSCSQCCLLSDCAFGRSQS